MHNDILKHLDIIKDAVALQDEDLIAMQVEALQSLPLDAKLKQILKLISTQRFQYVIQLIEQYTRDNNDVTTSEDPQIQGLKLELKVMGNRLNELSDSQVELARQINEFNSEYMQRLGGLIEEVLKKRAEQPNSDFDQQQEARLDYDAFERSYLQQPKDSVQTLTLEQQQQLKAAYCKASRLCHPDKFADEFKAQATESFKALNEAYCSQNLSRVIAILHHLETSKTLSRESESIHDKTTLQAKIAASRLRISKWESDISALQENKVYQRIQEITDRKSYFSWLEQELAVLAK